MVAWIISDFSIGRLATDGCGVGLTESVCFYVDFFFYERLSLSLSSLLRFVFVGWAIAIA